MLVSPRFVVPTQQRMRQLLKQRMVYFPFHSRAVAVHIVQCRWAREPHISDEVCLRSSWPVGGTGSTEATLSYLGVEPGITMSDALCLI